MSPRSLAHRGGHLQADVLSDERVSLYVPVSGTSRKLRAYSVQGHRCRVPSSKPNLRLRSDLAEGLAHSAAELGLGVSTLVAYLVRNDQIEPAELAAVEATPKLSKSPVSCWMAPRVQRWVARGAKRTRLQPNAYVEALIAKHVAEDGPFCVLRTKPGAKL